MVNIILFLALCIAANSAFVNADCDVGNSLIQNIDMNKFLDTWYLLYLSEDYANTYSCFIDTYRKDGSSYSLHTETKLTSGQTEIYTGPVAVSGNVLDVQYVNKRGLATNYTVLDTDYDNYAVISGCPPEGDSVLTYVQFRNKNPSDELISKIKNILHQTGHEFEDLKKSNC